MALRRRPLPIRCSVATLVCWVMCPTCNEAFADAVASLVLTAYIELDSVRQQKASKVRCWAACFRSCSWQQTVPLQHGFCFGNACPTWECSRHPLGLAKHGLGHPHKQLRVCLTVASRPDRQKSVHTSYSSLTLHLACCCPRGAMLASWHTLAGSCMCTPVAHIISDFMGPGVLLA